MGRLSAYHHKTSLRLFNKLNLSIKKKRKRKKGTAVLRVLMMQTQDTQVASVFD